ncbi:MAG: diguanylate cyclase, partial [Clostridiales bacterium]|nr:diguanylate cyclase [Clostridiales bacterium]
MPDSVKKKDKILIIDDTLLNISILADILSPDYEILYTQSGEKGLEMVMTEKPELVLLDIIMPGMDGYEVCRRLKEDPVTVDIPVIYVTALDEEHDEEKGLEAGAIDYIAKPFSSAIVKLRVKNHLELKKHRDRLELLSYMDGLTGIPNRREFDLFLEQEWNSSIRTRLPVALLMIDIDYFKQYNDNYGHLAGDDCLRQVAQALRGCLSRSTDIVARYGGEEFACILPRTNVGGAVIIAERLRECVENLGIRHDYSNAGRCVTVSVGVSIAVPSVGEEPERLVLKADRMLYS